MLTAAKVYFLIVLQPENGFSGNIATQENTTLTPNQVFDDRIS